jgi:hypothetical protein
MRGSSTTPAHRPPLEPRFGIRAARLPFVLCHPHDAQMRATYGSDERGYWVEVTRGELLVARGTFPSSPRSSALPLRPLILFMWTLGFFRDGKRRRGRSRPAASDVAANLRGDADE